MDDDSKPMARPPPSAEVQRSRFRALREVGARILASCRFGADEWVTITCKIQRAQSTVRSSSMASNGSARTFASAKWVPTMR
ncbi:hypothetical protein AKJ09_06812 [Labilithrix luteola]|uniref:Uncharacterized protein n=1 Tax=Labilithrix luteola TaxID=1391654 RepID=A0A0K1Q2Z8_9BACT|nr:hypothetical protein AKJ09_06812 [Labilithrix luteola]